MLRSTAHTDELRALGEICHGGRSGQSGSVYERFKRAAAGSAGLARMHMATPMDKVAAVSGRCTGTRARAMRSMRCIDVIHARGHAAEEAFLREADAGLGVFSHLITRALIRVVPLFRHAVRLFRRGAGTQSRGLAKEVGVRTVARVRLLGRAYLRLPPLPLLVVSHGT